LKNDILLTDMRRSGFSPLDKRFLRRYSERYIQFDTAVDTFHALPLFILMPHGAMAEISMVRYSVPAPAPPGQISRR
jgi:hypothetical protein